MTRDRDQSARFLHLDLGRLAFPLMLLILLASPYPRALFFASDLLPFHVLSAGVLSLCLLDAIILKTTYSWTPDILACLAIPVCYLISLFASVDKFGAITELLKYANYFAIYYVFRRTVANPMGLRSVLSVLVLSATGVAVIGLLSALGIAEFPASFMQGSILSTFQYRNALGGYLLAAIGASLTLSSGENGIITSGLLSVVNYIFALTIITTYSRGTWVVFPFVVLGLLFTLPRSHKWKALYVSIASMTCSFLVIRKFLEAIGQKSVRAGLAWLAVGAAVSVALDLVWRLGEHYVSQRGELDERYRTMVVALAVIYTVTVGGIYAMYAVDAYPNLIARILPKDVIRRAEGIKADESSLTGRVQFIKDAIKITLKSPIIGHGGGAWNALYHLVQDNLYWTTETHSHYFQMLTEVGLLGISAFGLMWFFVLQRYIGSRDPEQDDSHIALVTGALVAVAGLSLHAAMDFDLSMPANAYVVWSLLGAASGACTEWIPKQVVQPRHKVVQSIALLAVVVLLTVVPYNLYKAGHLGAEGARWMTVNNFAQAERSYARALRLNPWDGAYYVDLAQCKVGSYFVLKDNRLIAEADEYIRKAITIQPYNLPMRLKIIDLYMIQARFEDATRAAEQVSDILVMDPQAHEAVAKTSVVTAMNLMDLGRPNDAKFYIAKALAVMPRIETLANRNDRGYTGERLAATQETRLCTAQALALDGQYDMALQLLTRIRGDKTVGAEATMWAGLVQIKQGQAVQGLNLLNQATRAMPALKAEVSRLAQILGVQGLEVFR